MSKQKNNYDLGAAVGELLQKFACSSDAEQEHILEWLWEGMANIETDVEPEEFDEEETEVTL